MASEKDDGGPAFPIELPQGCSARQGISEGMTLRDYFAAKAMNGCLSYSYCCPSTGNYHENSSPEEVAKTAYLYADAMLKARQS